MGFYINVLGMEREGKAQFLKDNFGAESYWEPFDEVPPGKVLVCVVRNPMFEAAGVIYDRQEYEAWVQPDDMRPREFLLMDVGVVKELVPQVPLEV